MLEKKLCKWYGYATLKSVLNLIEVRSLNLDLASAIILSIIVTLYSIHGIRLMVILQ